MQLQCNICILSYLLLIWFKFPGRPMNIQLIGATESATSRIGRRGGSGGGGGGGGGGGAGGR